MSVWEKDPQELPGRLTALGFSVGEADMPLLAYAVSKAEQAVRNDCNLSEIPEALRCAVLDLAASDFLLARKAAPAADEDSALPYEQGVKSIQEGDTTVSYLTAGEGGMTPETRLDALISRLREDALHQLRPFRRLRW